MFVLREVKVVRFTPRINDKADPCQQMNSP